MFPLRKSLSTKLPPMIFHSSTGRSLRAKLGLKCFSRSFSTSNRKLVEALNIINQSVQPLPLNYMASEETYYQDPDVEDIESYSVGGYHPTSIGDVHCGERYHVVHKLGHGSYSTIWLAQDQMTGKYVSLKILQATQSENTHEPDILRLLSELDPCHEGQQFVTTLRNDFSISGPNGRHLCLVQDLAGCNITHSKELAADYKFSIESARSIAAQLLLGVAYLHSKGVFHGDLHPRNFLLNGAPINDLHIEEFNKRFEPYKSPVQDVYSGPIGPGAPPYAVFALDLGIPANKIVNPRVTICDYGTSCVLVDGASPDIYTPPIYCPPEGVFGGSGTFAADIWTLGISLYEVLGSRALFEVFSNDQDDIIRETISTLGPPPARWWNKWTQTCAFFKINSKWIHNAQGFFAAVKRPLQERMWCMGRGETPETCTWDYGGGEMRALEDMLRSMLAWEPGERATAERLLISEYMTKWALPAWRRQEARNKTQNSVGET